MEAVWTIAEGISRPGRLRISHKPATTRATRPECIQPFSATGSETCAREHRRVLSLDREGSVDDDDSSAADLAPFSLFYTLSVRIVSNVAMLVAPPAKHSRRPS